MKLVKEYIINEKFTLDSDPIRDLGIGLYAKRNFTTQKEFLEFMLWLIPALLKTDEIPKDIINDKSEHINNNYFKIIDRYLEEYISYKGAPMDNAICEIYAWNDIVSEFLLKGTINEKFIQDSDPIRDMGIGILEKFKNVALHLFIQDTENLIFCMEVHRNYIKFHVNQPTIENKFGKHTLKVSEYLKKYYLDMGKKSGFYDGILINPTPHYSRNKLSEFIFEIKEEYRNIPKKGEFIKTFKNDGIWDKKHLENY